ncbi:MAG: dihydroorotate dehydrogenase electron transfer subunit [Candidatus Cloacimonetes bacterium]|nr:dihydroorotate dehydrogenase electron transfer subunit [Candidatus Cloacimonadota bacterium]
MDKRITLPITKIITEATDIKTFGFEYDLKAKPGQFIMLTDFGKGEKPFSLADCTKTEFFITIKQIGDFTTRLFQKDVGDLISIRGPYGSSFFISQGNVLLIGGGFATPPLYFLSKELLKIGTKITVINGAKTNQQLIFSDRFEQLELNYMSTTQFGAHGNGTAVDRTKKLLKKEQFDYLYASGPEMMLNALSTILKDDEYEFLLERYMKCAVGICGSCTLDPIGIRLCMEGPVLPKRIVEQLTEFGKYHRDASGMRIKF